MKLYNCPRNSNVRLLEDASSPPGVFPVKQGETIMFNHIDGMYSYCLNSTGDPVHIAAWTEVELVK